jgi:hypothetical protein
LKSDPNPNTYHHIISGLRSVPSGGSDFFRRATSGNYCSAPHPHTSPHGRYHIQNHARTADVTGRPITHFQGQGWKLLTLTLTPTPNLTLTLILTLTPTLGRLSSTGFILQPCSRCETQNELGEEGGQEVVD